MNINRWKKELEKDPDKKFIEHGIEHGFDIVTRDVCHLKPVSFKNHRSAMDPLVKPSIEASIMKEIQKGNYVVTDRIPTIVSPIGAVPKSDGGID